MDVIYHKGIFAKAFPIICNKLKLNVSDLKEIDDIVDFSNKYRFRFENAGYMYKGEVYTTKVIPVVSKPITLGEISQEGVDKQYYLSKEEREKFKYLRGSKKIPRKDSNGYEYMYSEGAMSPYDDLSLPGRTMLTSEGSINRSTHIIKDPLTNKLRLLTPIECERLNQFPDNWTNTGMPEKRRYFMMGNALVCGIISKLGKEIEKIIDKEN